MPVVAESPDLARESQYHLDIILLLETRIIAIDTGNNANKKSEIMNYFTHTPQLTKTEFRSGTSLQSA